MAILPKPTTIAMMDDRSALPPGVYTAAITYSELKATKAKTGSYLALQLRVLEGDSKGRMLKTLLNLDNPNPVAVEIANKELNSIKAACDATEAEDSEELHGIPMLVTVGRRAGNAQYPESNTITGYAASTDTVDSGEASETVTKPWEQTPA